jgi:glycosyltransferase involved in cell wall biosynthesis
METQPRKVISIVVPVFDEELNIRAFYDRIRSMVFSLRYDYEVIFVDDGSRDRSFDIVREIARTDDRIKCVRFSRNFGSLAAYTAGLEFCRGDAAVVISCDLQDPPELINDLLARWETGAHVVWAVREARDDPFVRAFPARMFAHLFRHIGFKAYPLNGMDFGLFDRKVIDAYLSMPESSRVFVAMILWLGFNQTFVSYKRQSRAAGSSKWRFGRRLRSSIDAIVSFSQVPIWFISYFGIALSFVGFVYATFLIFGRLFYGIGDIGWASLMTALLFIGGVQMIMLGVIGEYVWRTADQSRCRPHFVVMDMVGLEPPHPRGQAATGRASQRVPVPQHLP